MNISKWLPIEDTAIQEFVKNCKKLNMLSLSLEKKLGNMLHGKDDCYSELEAIMEGLDTTGKLFSKVSGDHRVAIASNYKCKHWREHIREKRLSVMYLSLQVITSALSKYLEDRVQLVYVLRLIEFFDTLLALNSVTENQCTSVVRNTCPSMLHPMRKLSLTKILQVIAHIRADHCGQQLIYILLNLKTETEKMESDYPSSDNSSMEVYRALTENLSPVHENANVKKETTEENTPPEIAMLNGLLTLESHKLKPLFDTMAKETPDRLGPYFIKESRSKGDMRMSTKARQKVIAYYQEVLWGLVGTYAEYKLIWRAIGFQGEACNQWATWIKKLACNPTLPHILKPALQSLVDGLCLHITTVTWDHMFRKAMVAAGYQNSKYINNNYENGTYTGLMFSEMFSELVSLSNSCEGSNWTVAALEELPLTEQIPILHRLDHTIHTCRLWAEGKARQLANMWNMDQFFRVTQIDVAASLKELSNSHFANQNDLLGPECSVHVMVCGKMRAKLVSEVNANVEQLKAVPAQSIDVLASVTRTFSLANLKLMFPSPKYWKQQFDEIPQYASKYVEDYLDEILKPVVNATKTLEDPIQQKVSCLVLDIMCEAWLDHIYKNKIKFTEWGALQLLADFGAVPTWLMERVQATPNLLSTEMLRRCEGVGRLLLSQPGHRIPMIDKTIRKYQDEGESSPTRMPPEMYVPNQTQWLELRAQRNNYFSFCCSGLRIVSI
ncbi:unnamed protein product, partial [Nezara viridula]